MAKMAASQIRNRVSCGWLCIPIRCRQVGEVLGFAPARISRAAVEVNVPRQETAPDPKVDLNAEDDKAVYLDVLHFDHKEGTGPSICRPHWIGLDRKTPCLTFQTS